MRVRCPAKINLHLRVGRRRSDGFHPLLTWMTTVRLFDTLTVDALPPASAEILQLRSDLPGLPCDATNLVVRAAATFAAAVVESVDDGAARADGGVGTSVGAAGPAGRHRQRVDGQVARVRPVDVTLTKRIPLGAGLGGGSSDAARTLEALNVLWHAGWSADRLARLAATLGSDVPFFLHGPSSVCTGRGEHVRPTPPPSRARWAVLVLPEVHMPTADVYRRFDAMGFDDAIAEPPDWLQWASLPADELMSKLVNDLERPAFAIRPELKTLRDQVESAVARPVRMSGSGSSLFTLFDAEPAAEAAAAGVTARFGVRAVAAEVAPVLEDDLNTNFARA